MRRALSRLVFAGLLVTGALFAPAMAAASPLSADSVASCPTSNPYPPTPNAEVQSSTTTPQVGEQIEVSGVGYCADESVTITIGGKTVGTGHSDSSGKFDPEVTVPGPAGARQLCGVGSSGLSSDTDCLTLNSSAAGGASASASNSAGAGSGSGSGGGTAFTGVEVAALCALAALLLAGGVAFATAGRRRRPVSQS
jgi:large repetitive protein